MHILMFPWLPLWFLQVVGTRSMLSRRKWGLRDHRDSARIAGSARQFFRPIEIKGASKRLEMKHNEPICIYIYIYIYIYTVIIYIYYVCFIYFWWCPMFRLDSVYFLMFQEHGNLLNCSVDFTRFHGVKTELVGGIPTPLKNDGVRQLGWWNSQLMLESHSKLHGSSHHQPDISNHH